MAQNAGGIKIIAPASGQVSVNLFGPSGTAATIYADAAITTKLTGPFTVPAGTSQTAFVATPGPYTLSVIAGGVEGADPKQGKRLTLEMTPGMLGVYDYSTLSVSPSTWTPTVTNVGVGLRRALPKPADVDAVMASPPTVSALASATIIGSAVKWPSVTNSGSTTINTLSDYYSYNSAGGFVVHGPAFPDYTYVRPTSSTSSNWSMSYNVEFFFDGTTLDLIFKGIGPGSCRIRVDGQLVSATPVSITVNGADQIVPIVFASRAVRRISVEAAIAPWGGVNTGPTDTIWKSEMRGPRCIIIGDSVITTGATGSGCTSFVRRFGQAMGWADVWPSGVGGTGYLATASWVKFRDRIVTDCLQWNPDVVIVTGGMNDVGFTGAQILAEATLLFQQIRTALPAATIVATSPMAATGVSGIGSPILNIRDSIRTAVLSVGGFFVDFIEKPMDVVPVQTTLSSAAGVSATTLSLPTVIPVQATVELGPIGLRERRRVLSVSGGGPYTHTLDVALTNAHAQGDYVNQVGPSHWTGTGKVGATTGVGNCDLIVSADGVHPTQAGHDYLGSDLAALVARAVLAP